MNGSIDNVQVAIVVSLIGVGILIRIIIIQNPSIAKAVSIVTSVAWNIDVIRIGNIIINIVFLFIRTLIVTLPC